MDGGNPFLEHEFLLALEESGSVGPGTGWEPHYLTLELPPESGQMLLGAVPFYVRDDSWGEYIFDFQWSNGFESAGIPYYPKVTVAAPFTPATGGRLLVHPDAPFDTVAEALVRGLVEFTRSGGFSSLHVLFCTPRERDLMTRLGLLPRLTYQFHWTNYGYKSFDGYLDDLRSQKRKHVKRERREVGSQGLDISTDTGDSITAEHMDALWRFYRHTHLERGSEGYLKRPFFTKILETFRHRMVVVTARDQGKPVAGTFNFEKGPNLYGRYWGADRHIPYLHFELCFYRLIDHSIATGKELFEAGAQGEHKFLRGFAARPTYSCHWFANPNGRRAIEGFLERERPSVERTISSYNRVSPLKRVRGTAGGETGDETAADGRDEGIPPAPDGSGYAGE